MRYQVRSIARAVSSAGKLQLVLSTHGSLSHTVGNFFRQHFIYFLKNKKLFVRSIHFEEVEHYTMLQNMIKKTSYFRTLQTLETCGDGPTARWEIPLSDGNHVIEFIHGTATGQRIIKIDGNVLLHRDWMFRLVGDEVFTFGENKFVIRVDPIPGLQYSYTLWVNGKSYENFVQAQSKILETWQTEIDGNIYRVTLDKNTLVIWLNGEQVEAENDFIDGGAEMSFEIAEKPAVIRSYSFGQKNTGIEYSLYVDQVEISKHNLINHTIEETKPEKR